MASILLTTTIVMRKGRTTKGLTHAVRAAHARVRRREMQGHGTLSDFFHLVARRAADVFGSGWAFGVAVLVVVVWAATGPLFGYSDSWQLVVNTGTTIVTFLMVFLIQNAQNRDAKAFHLKLDELILKLHGARNRLMTLEDLTDAELDELHAAFQRLAKTRSPRASDPESGSEPARRAAN